jgi:hypothetical protein
VLIRRIIGANKVPPLETLVGSVSSREGKI